MITVKDINNKRFEQTRPGYSPAEVDDFLRELAKEIGNYQKDREDFEKKIEVLVGSVREYKKDEEALKDALIGAQKQGRAVITEAQQKAEVIIANATERAGDIIGSTKSQLEKEKRNLTKMQKEVSNFKRDLLAMYKQHLEQITAVPDYDDDYDDSDDSSDNVTSKTETTKQAENNTPATEVEEPSSHESQEPQDELEKFSSVAARRNTEAQNRTKTTTQEIPQEFVRNSYKENSKQFSTSEINGNSPFDEPKTTSRSASRFGDLKFGNNA